MHPTEDKVHSLFGYDTFQGDWRIVIITDRLIEVARAIVNPPTKHLVYGIVLILKEETILVLLRVAHVCDIVVLIENDSTAEWLRLILNNFMEFFDAIVQSIKIVPYVPAA